MHNILIIDKQANVKETRVSNINENELYKKAGLKTRGTFELQTTLEVQLNKKYIIKLFAKKDGRAGYENKYEFPPPIDKDLYFGNVILVNNNDNLTLDEWEAIYDKLNGGFEDLDDSEEEEDEDEEGEFVKEGYKKDGFIVDDSEESDYSDESDEFDLTDELSEEEYV